jgi:hypothetical protein
MIISNFEIIFCLENGTIDYLVIMRIFKAFIHPIEYHSTRDLSHWVDDPNPCLIVFIRVKSTSLCTKY